MVFLVLLIFINVVKILGCKVLFMLWSNCSFDDFIFLVIIFSGMFIKYDMLLKVIVKG